MARLNAAFISLFCFCEGAAFFGGYSRDGDLLQYTYHVHRHDTVSSHGQSVLAQLSHLGLAGFRPFVAPLHFPQAAWLRRSLSHVSKFTTAKTLNTITVLCHKTRHPLIHCFSALHKIVSSFSLSHENKRTRLHVLIFT